MFTDNGYCNNVLLTHPILKLVDEKMKEYDPTKSPAVKYGFVSDRCVQYIKSIIKSCDTELIWIEFNTPSRCYLDIDTADTVLHGLAICSQMKNCHCIALHRCV